MTGRSIVIWTEWYTVTGSTHHIKWLWTLCLWIRILREGSLQNGGLSGDSVVRRYMYFSNRIRVPDSIWLIQNSTGSAFARPLLPREKSAENDSKHIKVFRFILRGEIGGCTTYGEQHLPKYGSMTNDHDAKMIDVDKKVSWIWDSDIVTQSR